MIRKPILLTLVLFLTVTVTFANSGDKAESSNEPVELETEKEMPSVEPDKKKDSVIVIPNKVESSILSGIQTNYKPIKPDSTQNSNDVLSFNFIQYMIQRFKFTEVGY